MITDTYPNTLHDISIRSMLKNEDLGNLISEQRLQQEAATEREKELNIFRSGSAPPTVEGSLSSFGGLYDSAAIHGIRKSNECGFLREEDIRSDPAYANYYYSNVNLNPRLPPPLGSKEDWRLAQKLNYSSDGVGVNSVVGDGRKESKAGYGEGQRSLFSVQPGFGEGKYENGNGESVECGGDGLIGLPSLRLGMRQKSIAEMIQDDLDHVKPISRHPSRPPSRNAFDEGVDVFEGHFAHLRRDSVSDDILYNANKQGGSLIPNTGSSASLSYASAVGNSSRSGTPDPQLMARAPSPHILPIGGGRTSSVDRRDGNGSNIFSGISSSLSESQLVGTFLGLNLLTDQIVDGETHSHSHSQNGIDDCQNAFRMLGNHKNIKQQLYVKSVPSNSYVKGPAMQNLNGRSGFAHTHPNMDNIYSSFANYGLNGYHINPSSPSIVGAQLGTGNLPPLFDNTFAASAIGGNGLDAGSLGALDPNLMAAAVELHNLRRVGNQSGGNAGFQDPLMDPLYLQYLQSNEYVAVNKAANDGEYLRNPYMDLLQKGYLGTLLAPQKSQYGLPYLGKSGSLSHSFHGNSALGLDLSYPGSPLGGPLLPHSPIGSGSTVMQSERNLRFSSGMRNLSGGLVGGWNSESGGILNENFPSSLLDEFKSNKTRCFELSEIASHVVEFSADQYGSRFIQQKLETATIEEKNMVFSEIMPQALSLMTDVFGNYVIQKFFEHGSTSQIRELADQLTGHVLTLSLQMYGCRVIQKAIEIVELDQQTKMVKELDGHIMRCVRDQNGNHVIQKCIECVPEDFRQFIVSTFYDQVVTLSTHPYGCRVIQRVLEHCHDAKTQKIMMDEILQSVCMLAQDQYGNYVVQHVLEHGKPHERSAIITKLCGQIVQMSQQKFASNVIEKCLTFGTPTERQTLVDEMLGTNENEPLQVMMKDQFANYVVQKVLETCDDQQLEIILNRIKVHLNALKKYTYGKHIVARVEKLVAAGERRISGLTLHPAA